MGLNPWTYTSPLSLSYHAVAYGGGVFVAAGPASIARSSDEGATWLSGGGTKQYAGVAYGESTFVVVGSFTTSGVGGLNWSAPISHTNGGVTQFLRAIVHGTPAAGGLFVAVGDAGTIFTTPDGLTWTSQTPPTTENLVDVAFGNQLFVAVAFGGKVLTSPDGVTWTVASTVPTPFRKIGFGKNMFLGVDGSKAVRKSADGVSWTTVSTALASIPDAMDSIKFGFDVFVVVGPNGAILTSSDGVTWTPHTSGSLQHLGGVAYGKNRFVAVGAASQGHIVRSGEYPSGDLSALTCSAAPLTPAFNPLVQAYSAEGSAGSVTPTSEDPLATIKVQVDSGASAVVASGTASAVAQVPGRPRTFQIKVAARNGLTKDYRVVLHRTPWVTRVLSVWPFTWFFPRP